MGYPSQLVQYTSISTPHTYSGVTCAGGASRRGHHANVALVAQPRQCGHSSGISSRRVAVDHVSVTARGMGRTVRVGRARSSGPVRSTTLTLLFHCDESYDERYHVHLGVLSTGAQAAAAEQAVHALRNKLNWHVIKGWLRELHGYPLFAGIDEWGGVDPDLRVEVYREALQIIVDHELEVLYRGMNMVEYRRRYSASRDPKGDAFKFMFGDLLSWHLRKRCATREEFALVVTDRQNQYEYELRYAHEVGQASYRRFNGRYGIIDTCHFVNSEHSPLVQLADMAAFVKRRRLSIPEEADPRLEAVMAELAGVVSSAVPEPAYSHCSVRRFY